MGPFRPAAAVGGRVCRRTGEGAAPEDRSLAGRNSAATVPRVSTCPRCGVELSADGAVYDGAGDLVCRACAAAATVREANREIAVKDPLSTKNVWRGAIGTALVGSMSLCLVFVGQFFFVAAPLAIVASGWTLYYVATRGDLRKRLGLGTWVVLALSILGRDCGNRGVRARRVHAALVSHAAVLPRREALHGLVTFLSRRSPTSIAPRFVRRSRARRRSAFASRSGALRRKR